jgi:hypothetical protein
MVDRPCPCHILLLVTNPNVTRSSSLSISAVDDAVGPTTDEYFTVTIGGPQTILNNSNEVVHVGDTLAWTFYSENDKTSTIKRQRTGAPRRVGLRIASYSELEGLNPALAPRSHAEPVSDGALRALLCCAQWTTGMCTTLNNRAPSRGHRSLHLLSSLPSFLAFAAKSGERSLLPGANRSLEPRKRAPFRSRCARSYVN